MLIRLYAAHSDHFDTKKMAALIFPDGMIKADFNSLPPGPPNHGARFTTGSNPLTYAGLRMDDIVVALDGYQVTNLDQYAYLSAFNHDPNMTFIIWRKDRYLKIHANVPGHLFGVGLQTVRP